MEHYIKDASALQTTQETPINKQFKAQCRYNNVAYHVCIEQSCKSQSALICLTQNCNCHFEHKRCSKADIAHLFQTCSQKIKDVQQIKKEVEKVINNKIVQMNQKIVQINQKIVQMNQFKDKVLKIIDENILHTKLYQIEKNFLNMVLQQQDTQKQSYSFKSKDSGLLWRIVKSEENSDKQMLEETKRMFRRFQKKLNKFEIQKEQFEIQKEKTLMACIKNLKQKMQQYKKNKQKFFQVKLKQANKSEEKGKGKEQTETQLDSEANQSSRQELNQLHKVVSQPNIFSDDDDRFD